MRRSYLETFFRHRVLVLAPVLLAFVLSTVYGLQQRPTYLASASVWSDAGLPNDSTIGTTGGTTPPSAGQAALLNELLASRSFLRQVALASPLRGRVSGPDSYAVDHALSRLASSVVLTTVGPQVLSIAVTQDQPDVAVGVAKAVAEQLLEHENGSLTQRATVQSTYDAAQRDAAAAAVTQAQAVLAAYESAQPQGPQTETLLGAVTTAQEQLADAQKAVAKDAASLAHIGDGSVLRVLDAPTRAYAQSRRKVLILMSLGGLLAGGTVSAALLLLLMARDRSVRAPEELERALGLEVVSTVAHVPAPGRRRRRSAGPHATAPAGSGAEHAGRDRSRS